MNKLLEVLVLISVAWTAANGNVPSPGSKNVPAPTSTDCSTLIYNMIDCLPYMTKGSNDTKPESSCCSGFKKVVMTDSQCICSALKSSASLGIEIDMNRAGKLHTYCHVDANPLDQCQAAPTPENPAPKKSPRPPTPGSHHNRAPAPAPASLATMQSIPAAMSSFLIGIVIYVFFN